MAAIAGEAGIERIGVWFGPGLENALATRASMGALQAEHPGADWVLLGPANSYFLFEMDARVPVYIPLKNLEPRRPAQTRLSYYLEKRAQFKKLRDLQLNTCLGVSVVLPTAALNKQALQQFQHVQTMLKVGGQFIQKELPELLVAERPTLQAGPQALAFATQLYRKVAPGLQKVVVLLHREEVGHGWDKQWPAMQQYLAELGVAHHLTVAAIVGDNRLLARHLNKSQPTWLQIDLKQAMGLMAYADRVICASPQITQICAEMGRSDRLVLLNSHI